ncbi:S1C family serine protease [Nonomuraea sp. NPDC050394]|uniref:S1C family serine protease n=1 Tax=Nonomuraea sp. NPDC050394 TaxID=3364363 RepID=UPI0037A5DC74
MRLIAAGLAVVLAAGCGASTPQGTGTATPSGSPSGGAPQAAQGTRELESGYEQIITQVLPSIVQITTKVGLGSGIVYDASGHVVTNAHVVGQATEMEVSLATGGTPRKAKLVSSFPAGDLAVIKVEDANGLKPATFGDSSKLRVGQLVLAMGNPLGLSGSVTQGIVSALGRTVSEPQNPGSPGATIAGAIQTSAAINPGNSGGALVDMSGQVIGIPTLAATDPELGGGAAPGIGFAIPSNTAADIAGQIVKSGKVTNSHRAALGLRGRTVLGENGQPVGVAVAGVEPGGAAAKAGIDTGDVIVSLNGKPTPTMSDLSEILTTLKPGDQVKVEVIRPDGTTETVTATLGELKA